MTHQCTCQHHAGEQELFSYRCVAQDEKTSARAGVFKTAHGDVLTPTFMPVGTRGALKGVTVEQLKAIGAQVVLGNTYHLSMRPGEKLIKAAGPGGLHDFMGWDGPILTDSGGFQVFSLADIRKITPDGVEFRSVYDGSKVFWTPEDNMRIQEDLGADICMQLDECIGYPAEKSDVARAMDLSSAWAERCARAHTKEDQALFGIVQGGMHLDLRLKSLERLESMADFPGYGIGGYSVGEDHEVMFESLEPLASQYMPKHKPRYLMGVGNPTTLVRAVACGVDLFDCVLPTRTGRTGTIFSSEGKLALKHARFKDDFGPLDPECTCPVCQKYSRAYVRHLIQCKEMVGATLASLHNLYYLIDLMRQAREAICEQRYDEFVRAWMDSPAARDY